MFSKSLLTLAVAGVMFSGSAFAVTTLPVPMIVNDGDPTTYTGSFNANLDENTFSFTFPTGAYNLFAVVDASHYASFGYNVSSVTFDGKLFTADLNKTNSDGSRSSDSWSYELATISPVTHYVVVKGTPYATNGYASGEFVVSSKPLGVLAPPVSPVPEPGTITMMLAGLALVGGLQLRRKNKASQLAG